MVVKLINFVWFLVKNRAHKEAVETAMRMYLHHVLVKDERAFKGVVNVGFG